MKFIDEPPFAERLPPDLAQEGSAVTFIRTLPPREKPAGPSAFGFRLRAFGKAVRRLVIAAAVIAALAAYPVMTVRAHQVDASAPDMSGAGPDWASASGGLATLLISREVDGSGWVADKADWRPEARLTAAPAWQAGLSQGLSDFLAMRAALIPQEGVADADLMTASRLLAVRDDGLMGERLRAAREALIRHDGRVRRGAVAAPDAMAARTATLSLITDLATQTETELAAAAAQSDPVLADRAAISAVYAARARAQVAYVALLALPADDPAFAGEEARAALDAALSAWRRVADTSPVLVMNAPPGAFLRGNDVMTAGFMTREASLRTNALAAIAPPQAPVAEEPTTTEPENAGSAGADEEAAALVAAYAGPSLKPAQLR